MICEVNVRKFCNEDIDKIENYDKAITDSSKTWHCHHRDEIRTLPSGITVIRSMQDLKDTGRYYDCPANELIFLTPSEHQKIHHDDTIHPLYGKTRSDDEKKKIASSTRKSLRALATSYREYKESGGTLSWNEYQRLK